LMKLYKIPSEKIEVIYEGAPSGNLKFEILNLKSNINDKILNYKPYLLFIGRLERRKNIEGIVEVFKILKEKYPVPHKLVLAGKPGFGYDNLKLKIENSFKISNLKFQIIELGYIDEALKWQLLSNADVFLFPTFYEGFGLPILEAQSVGVPVVAGNNSSIPEIAGVETDCNPSLLMVNPNDPNEIAEATYKLISDKTLRDGIIEKGYENVKRFSWEKCSREIARWLIGANEKAN
jgi:glycosyltransferase involved in cell wall biosynthesis